ncbi:tannase/feruloyl esterase family alpha/beta hydrolase [Variovorax sp. J22R24]|uniref:tannase/feruloyl esterase family alpha/beta hydrolase n=1 Tax=Variovorax gracilis TaxID=3053502 RepID=UPI002576A3ED|nr:tannase/feruloyl esterase family alpha/beta hydrolase [Variovorax sp. J22R24]MDM0104846.1 tannase/feruloyl esterase family alpha/beta hydrolase [Variovorax sp. J22R24]
MKNIRFGNLCTLGLMAAPLAAGCASRTPAPTQLEPGCSALTGRVIPAASIGLPSGDAFITSTTVVGASAGPPAVPTHCRALGSIAPRGGTAQRIHFQLNLPLDGWNGKALQYGGGGFNGTLVTGMTPLRDAAPGDPLPIERGYLTYGTDSGHQASAWPASEPGAFALDNEMLANFAFASYKKVRDVAVAVSQIFYGRPPQRVYYFGGSEGGREGLMMAQRFPADYDGVVSVVPVLNWTGLFHAFVRNQRPQFVDWLPPAKAPLVARAVNDACDGLDGLADGVVNHWKACQGRGDLQLLRCPGGNDSGASCLSDGQIRALQAVHTPYRFAFALANGLDSYPPWLWGHEYSLDGATAR